MKLEVENLRAGYGPVDVLHGIDLAVEPGTVLGLLGRNGAGKTTLLRAIMGLTARASGSVRCGGTELLGLAPHRIPGHRIAYVPQGRRLFAAMSVAENLRMGILAGGENDAPARLAFALERFPALEERLRTPAGRLSGGQQQMLAMARALATGARVLLLDEPNEGLAPSLVDRILATIAHLRADGVTMLLVEQKVEAALRVADRIAFIEQGRIREHATPADLGRDPAPLVRYVGARRA